MIDQHRLGKRRRTSSTSSLGLEGLEEQRVSVEVQREVDEAEAPAALLRLDGGVERQLWQAKGWVLPDGSGGLLNQRSAEAELSVYAQRFRLSSLEPILKDTPIIDAEQTEVDASLELRFAQRVLDFAGKFHMAGLSVFTPRLVAEPVRNIGLDLSARGRVDLKTRRFRLDKAAVRWNGATAELEAEAEAQPASALRHPAPVAATGATPAAAPGQVAAPAGPGWRERWRTVSLHLTVPPLDCQALLDSMPDAIVPRIRDFKLAGSFSTDVRVFVDFAPAAPGVAAKERPGPGRFRIRCRGCARRRGRGRGG